MHSQQVEYLLRIHHPQAMEAFLRQYTPLMRYILHPILPDERDQEEVLSDISMQVWEKIGTYDPQKGSFSTWLTALTRNTALNRVRRQPPPSEPLEDVHTPSAPSPEEQILQKEQQQILHRTLMTLSDRDRMLFYRKYYYLQSTSQIARELGMTERAVEGRLYRLKQRLKSKLRGDLYG